MKFLTLFNKIGKLPIKYTKIEDVTAVLNVGDLKKLIHGKPEWDSISVPLILQISSGGKHMRLLADIKKIKFKPRYCSECSLGEKKTIVGNGITEPPYINVVKCPYETEYYKSPDNKCDHTKEFESR